MTEQAPERKYEGEKERNNEKNELTNLIITNKTVWRINTRTTATQFRSHKL